MDQEQDQVSANEPTPQQEAAPAPVPTPPPAPPAPQEPVVETPQVGDDDLPDWVMKERKQLREESAKYRVQLREEQEKWQGGLTAAEVQALRQEIHSLQAEGVARELGLPQSLASRLQGNTIEELRADAQAILSEMPAGAGRLSGGLNPSDPDTSTEDEVMERVRARRTRRF